MVTTVKMYLEKIEYAESVDARGKRVAQADLHFASRSGMSGHTLPQTGGVVQFHYAKVQVAPEAAKKAVLGQVYEVRFKAKADKKSKKVTA